MNSGAAAHAMLLPVYECAAAEMQPTVEQVENLYYHTEAEE